MSIGMIHIAVEYSRYPGGRHISGGPFSGEDFREKFLIPLWKKNERVIIELDGTRGYGSSFLEEAFGGMVRAGYIKNDDDIGRLDLRTEDDFLKLEIKDYIQDAIRHRQKYN